MAGLPRLAGITAVIFFLAAMAAGLAVAFLQRSGDSMPATPLTAIRIVFGSSGSPPRAWDGGATVSAGSIVRAEGWLFSARDSIEGRAGWRCSSKASLATGQPDAARAGMCADLAGLNAEARHPRSEVGVILYLDAAASGSELKVHTAQGDFSVALAELKPANPLRRLEGEARIELVPAPLAPRPDAFEQDWPAMAPAHGGGFWIAWQSFDLAKHQDRILVARWQDNIFSAPEDVSGPGNVYRAQVAEITDRAGQSTLWVVWSQLDGDNWDLYARYRRGSTWSAVQRLTSDPGSDFNARLAPGPDGTLWLAWQGFRGGVSRVLLSRLADARWSDPVAASQEESNAWEPSMAVDSTGKATLVWDSFRLGSYNVYTRSYWGAGQMSEILPVAASETFEAHSDVAIDRDDRAWFTWDDGGLNWGLDSICAGLRATRSIGLRAMRNGRWEEPPALPMSELPSPLAGRLEHPRVIAAQDGRVWLFLRYWSMRQPNTFEIVAVHQTQTGWSGPIFIPHTVGREYFVPSAALADGRLWLVWATDSREPRNVGLKHNQVYVAAMPSPGDWAGAKMSAPPAFYEVQAPVPAEPPRYRVNVGGKPYRVFWGDMHRHTDISSHGFTDGSIEDSMRYALDVARLDFLASTDHAAIHRPSQWEEMRGDDYLWWRIQKVDDLLFVPGLFVPIYGYERSMFPPAGHHNVFFLRRGAVPLPTDGHVPKDSTDLSFWERIRGPQVLTFPHTTGETRQPLNNFDHPNPDFEPLVEIYQGFRSSYEYAGAPRDGRIGSGQVSEPGPFFQDALKKGYRYGVAASSDHLSTHRGYIAVFAEDLSREALFGAIRDRHTFAASDKIIVDFQIGGHLQGEEIRTAKAPVLSVKVIGTAKIRRVEVVRNNQSIYTVQPGSENATFRYRDARPPEGTNYYYIRVIQEDQNMAWSSPIWANAGTGGR